jgi:transposase
VRATTLLNNLLDLPGVDVSGVSFDGRRMLVEVRLRAQRLACPLCSFTTRARYDIRPVSSCWRHLDFGTAAVVVRACLRRVDCPEHGVLVEAVPFARYRSGFTRDFEDVTGYLATKTDKTTIARFLRIDWDTVGRICERVVATELDEDRLDGLVNIGVDEISWRKHHRYLTLVTDHTRGKVVWGKAGKDTATLDAFFDDLGPDRAAAIEAVSMDMGPAFAKSVRADGHAPQAMICIDPFHAVKLVGEALDVERRKAWNELRHSGNSAAARKFKGARWALLKNPGNLTDDQAATLRKRKAPRRRRLARLPVERDLPRHLRRRPRPRLRRRADRPVDLASQPLPLTRIRQDRQDHPQAPRRHPRRDPTGHQQRPQRGPQLRRPPHHQPRPRLPQRRSRPRPRHARLRTDHPPATPRTTQHSSRMTHIHAGRTLNHSACPNRRSAYQRRPLL